MMFVCEEGHEEICFRGDSGVCPLCEALADVEELAGMLEEAEDEDEAAEECCGEEDCCCDDDDDDEDIDMDALLDDIEELRAALDEIAEGLDIEE